MNEHETKDPEQPVHYRIRPVVTPAHNLAEPKRKPDKRNKEFLRPEAEDDDGYDPFSDRPPTPESTFEQDPWQ